jgi:hypothetical protein
MTPSIRGSRQLGRKSARAALELAPQLPVTASKSSGTALKAVIRGLWRVVSDAIRSQGTTTGLPLSITRYSTLQSTEHPTRMVTLCTRRYALGVVSQQSLRGTHSPLATGAAMTVLGFLALFLAFSFSTLAQSETASVSGRVTDPKGGVVPMTVVEAIQDDTNVKATTETNADGLYDFPTLRPASYRIVVSKDGFKQVIQSGVVLHTQDSVTLNFALEIGSVSESVTINASDEHMESDNPAVSLLVDRDFVENMPLNGRSFQDLIALAPGAVSTSNGNYSIDGERDDANNFTVDGVAANLGATSSSSGVTAQQISGSYPGQTAIGTTQSLVSVDAMQEFRIQTSGYTAEYGRQPGGQIAITTRSGTNDYHGTAFDYLRNTVMDANNWFAKHEGGQRQAEQQNDFGGTLGGPVSIPKLYSGKDKTFFFFSYEGLRLLLPGYISDDAVPSTALRQSAAPGVQPFLNANPLPNGATNADGLTALFSGGYSSPNGLDSWGIRIDQALGEKFRLFFRAAGTSSNAEYPYQPLSSANRLENDTLTETVGATFLITPMLLDELRFNYSRSDGKAVTVPFSIGGATPLPLDLLVPSQYASLPGGYFGGGDIAVGSLYQDYEYYNYPLRQRQYNLVDSLSWTRGSHIVKAGVDYRRLTPVAGYNQYESYFGLGSVVDIQQGNADFLEIETGVAASPVFHELSLYAQDHWKVTQHVTLDYGLRWEFNPPPGASDGLYPPALSSSNLATAQLAPVGAPLYQTVYHNFAPRIGFAWQIPGASTRPIVVRGGTGIFYDTGQNLGAAAYSSANPPFGATNFLSNVPVPFPASSFVPPPLNTTLVPPYSFLTGLSDPHLQLPYTASWNLAVDAGLSARNTLTVSYVGNVGERLLFQQIGLPNNADFNSYYNVVATNLASSSYNALLIQDRGYLAPGLQVIASYTFAHALDNASTDGQFFYASTPLWGNSNNDIRHSFNLALNYEIPGTESNGLLKALTRGWMLGNRFSAQTGYPLNVFQGLAFPPTGQVLQIIPDLVPDVPVYLHGVPDVPGGWELNRAAFQDVPLNPDGTPTRLGTLGRNFVHGPAFWNLNSSVQRNFALTERFRLLARVDAFNIFNHPNFGSIQGFLPASNFGESEATAALGANTPTGGLVGASVPIYATGAPRSLQVSLKLQF